MFSSIRRWRGSRANCITIFIMRTWLSFMVYTFGQWSSIICYIRSATKLPWRLYFINIIMLVKMCPANDAKNTRRYAQNNMDENEKKNKRQIQKCAIQPDRREKLVFYLQSFFYNLFLLQSRFYELKYKCYSICYIFMFIRVYMCACYNVVEACGTGIFASVREFVFHSSFFLLFFSLSLSPSLFISLSFVVS